MRIDVFTIFPELIEGFANGSLLGRARGESRLDLRVRDLRAATRDARRSVDDSPFGGGAGMVLMPEPVFGAVDLDGLRPQHDPAQRLGLLSHFNPVEAHDETIAVGTRLDHA